MGWVDGIECVCLCMCLLVKGQGKKRGKRGELTGRRATGWSIRAVWQNADTVGPEVIKGKKHQVNDFTMCVTYTEVK